jgi:DNA invertase Pin-like site-specific DNA recombinase
MKNLSTHPKVRSDHLRRQAIVYVRQSGPHQVRENRESSARQYALVERAKTLGWAAQAVTIVDEDQARTATIAAHRDGFKNLTAEIGAGQVGVVLALEASRLARSSADWHRLVEICVVTQTLLADESAVYHPRDPNDRLLLGLKGTISEADLFTLRSRLNEGRLNKTRRGELTQVLPVGYVRSEVGAAVKDPDRQVQERLTYIFRLFDRHKVARQVLVQLVKEKLQIPAKVWGGPRHGRVIWKAPDVSDVIRLLRNPTYAGAYVYGRKQYDSFNRSPITGRSKYHLRRQEDWLVCLRDSHPAYITWEQFVRNQEILTANGYGFGRRGAPRSGRALLQGIVYCGLCGGQISALYYSNREKRAHGYACMYEYQRHGGKLCQCFSSAGVDEAVAKLFLDVVSPAKIEIALHALEGLAADRSETCKQWDLQLQRAEYEVELARRRYEAADPENRLVTGELEALWEAALRRRDQLRRQRAELDTRQEKLVSESDREQLRALASDLEQVWQAPTTSMEDRKTLIRMLIKRVHLDGVTHAGKIDIDVEWHTGAHTKMTIDRPIVGNWAPTTPQKAVERIHELLVDKDYLTIAATLNAEGFRTATGLPYDKEIIGYIVRSRGWGRRRGQHGKRGEA